jgi:regulator of sigma E protease
MLVVGILVGLFILVLLVVVHELGHGIVARRNGVVVEEFGIGFPPKAWGKKVKQSVLGKNVLFTLNWLPLGGFVRLQGEHDSATHKGDYGAASYWVKTKILLAGVAMNWLIAAVLLTGLAFVGIPKIITNQFSVPGDTQIIRKPLTAVTVQSGSPAEKAGLKPNDLMLRLNGLALETPERLQQLTAENRGKTVEIIYTRDGVERTANVPLKASNSDGKGYLGVGPGQREDIKATWSAPIVGVGTTAQFTWVTLKGTGEIAWNTLKGFVKSLAFWNQSAQQSGNKELDTVSKNVAGPVGILGVIFPQAQQAGFKQLVFLSAIISLSLAVMNALPIPALDGGRWWTMTIFKLLKKPLTKEREEAIQATGFFVLMGLVILVTWADVGKFFQK